LNLAERGSYNLDYIVVDRQLELETLADSANQGAHLSFQQVRCCTTSLR
jgi:hypothetical protein